MVIIDCHERNTSTVVISTSKVEDSFYDVARDRRCHSSMVLRQPPVRHDPLAVLGNTPRPGVSQVHAK